MKKTGIVYLIFGCLVAMSSCVTEPLLPGNLLTKNVEEEVLCPEGIVSFKYEVLPIIVSNCAFEGCHDATTAAYGIVLETYDGIIKEVKPGDPKDSELYEAIVDMGDDIMPPPPYDPLSEANISLIRRWIEQGAKETSCGDGCIPDAASFSQNIMPTLESFCIGCHTDSNLQGDVNLKDYEHVLIYVNNGELLGTIEHLQGYNPMPPSGNKLTDCRISQIKNWVAAGAQNN